MLPKLLSIILFVAVFSAQSKAQSVFYLYEDSGKTLTAQSALQLYQQGKFTAQKKVAVNIGFTSSIFWLAYKNEQQLPADSLLIFIGHHHINRIHFYFVKDSVPIQQWVTGDYFPFHQRPIEATGYYFPLNDKGIYLAKIDKANESLQLSFKTITHVQMLSAEGEEKIVMAIFTGIIILLVIFGIYLFALSRDVVYVYYVLYISSGWLWVLANAGYGFQYLWPNLPWFASKARPLFALMPLIFSSLYLLKYVGIKNKISRRFIHGFNIFLSACILLILFFNEDGYQSKWWFYIQYLIPLITLLYVVFITVLLTAASLKGNRLAMFYLAAIVTLIFFALLQILFSLGNLSGLSSFLSTFGISVGYVMEAIILTAGLVYRFIRYKVERENLLIQLNTKQQENIRNILEVQKTERSRIANQLHDVAGSLLSAATLNLSTIKEKELLSTDEAKLHLSKADEAVVMVGDMVRDLSHALSPVMLEKVGFKTAIEKIIGMFNASGKIKITLLVIGFEKYKPELDDYYNALYSIIYELLNNISKHSKASQAMLQVAEYEDCFSLIAEDNGIGIQPQPDALTPTLGLGGIQAKIDYFSGQLVIENLTPTGVIITIEIPIKLDANKSYTGR